MTKIEDYNIIWDFPSENSCGSMPLGNGVIALFLLHKRKNGNKVMEPHFIFWKDVKKEMEIWRDLKLLYSFTSS